MQSSVGFPVTLTGGRIFPCPFQLIAGCSYSGFSLLVLRVLVFSLFALLAPLKILGRKPFLCTAAQLYCLICYMPYYHLLYYNTA